MSRDCCVVLPRGAMGLSTVCDCVFPDHTDLLFLVYVTLTFNTNAIVEK